MARVSAYWRPASLDEALALLERPGAVVMGGGTKINATPTEQPIEVVDLQALDIHLIRRLDPGTLVIGATTTLQQVADCPDVPESIRVAARRELPSTLRSQATIAGTVMSRDPDSELLAVLLVHDAVVRVAGRNGRAELGLASLLGNPSVLGPRIVTAIAIETSGVTSTARTGRTRADRPIVAAAGRRTEDGSRRLALTGVAPTPVLVDRLDDLDPPGDFRGTSEYRRALAATLSARVIEAIS